MGAEVLAGSKAHAGMGGGGARREQGGEREERGGRGAHTRRHSPSVRRISHGGVRSREGTPEEGGRPDGVSAACPPPPVRHIGAVSSDWMLPVGRVEELVAARAIGFPHDANKTEGGNDSFS